MKHVLIVTLALLAVRGRGDELTNLFGYHPGMEVPSELRSRIMSAPGLGETVEITATNSFFGFSNATLILERNGGWRIKSLRTRLWMTEEIALTNVRSNVIAAIGSHGVTNNDFAIFKRGVCEIVLHPVRRDPSGSNLLTMSLNGPRIIAERELRNARLDVPRPNDIVGAFGQRLGSRVVEGQFFGSWETNRGEIRYSYFTNNTTFGTNVFVVTRINPATGMIVEMLGGGNEYTSREEAEGIYERVRSLIESKHGKLYRHPEWPMICTLNQKGNNIMIWDVKQKTNGNWSVRVQYRDSAANALEREEDF